MIRKCLLNKFEGKTNYGDATLIRCAGATTSVNASSDATRNEPDLPTPNMIIKTQNEKIEEEIGRVLALDLKLYPRYKRNKSTEKAILQKNKEAKTKEKLLLLLTAERW